MPLSAILIVPAEVHAAAACCHHPARCCHHTLQPHCVTCCACSLQFLGSWSWSFLFWMAVSAILAGASGCAASLVLWRAVVILAAPGAAQLAVPRASPLSKADSVVSDEEDLLDRHRGGCAGGRCRAPACLSTGTSSAKKHQQLSAEADSEHIVCAVCLACLLKRAHSYSGHCLLGVWEYLPLLLPHQSAQAVMDYNRVVSVGHLIQSSMASSKHT